MQTFKSIAFRLALLGSAVATPSAYSAVTEPVPSDVTTRAMSVVWVSDEPVVSASVRIFSDANGSDDITAALVTNVVSQIQAQAHPLGIVKVDVTGLAADTTYYAQATTVTSSGTLLSPTGPPFIEVRTAAKTAKDSALAETIVNDLLSVSARQPDGASAAPGTLVLVEAVGLSSYPVTAFVDDNAFAPELAVTDLNNVFDAGGNTISLASDQILLVRHLRGLLCSDAGEQEQVRYRRVPAQQEFPLVTNLAAAQACFFADPVCDDTVNVLDLQFLLNAFDRVVGDCAFNGDLDIVDDSVINVLDMQALLNRFGETAPFTPMRQRQ